MTVGELQAKMSATELKEWQVFYAMEPFGHIRDDLNAGLITNTMMNIHRGEKQSAYKLEDTMLRFEKKQVKQQSQQEISARLMAWCGGKKQG